MHYGGMDKADGAFLTIGELARDLGVAQHILRYWESRFSQLKPLQRSGNRRYYRPTDVAVARRINQLLNEQGFTVRGAQRVLSGAVDVPVDAPAPATAQPSVSKADGQPTTVPTARPASEPILAPPTAPAPAPAPAAALTDMSSKRSAAQIDLFASDVAPAPSQFDSADIAILIARLTVIRESLRDAIEAR